MMKCLSFQPYFVERDLIVCWWTNESKCKKIGTIFKTSGTRMSGTLESAWILSTSHDPGIVLFITRTRPKTWVFCEGSTFAHHRQNWNPHKMHQSFTRCPASCLHLLSWYRYQSPCDFEKMDKMLGLQTPLFQSS